MTRHLGFFLNIIAIGLFFPGILLPMFSLSMDMSAAITGTSISSSIVDKELSIMATIQELWQDDRLLVAGLIFAFSVVVPLCKTSLVSIAYFKHKTLWEQRLLNFVASIGKWSMADVFVVAVFLAILSTNHAETAETHQFTIFGFNMVLDVSTQTLSNAKQGFYFFTGYCVMSLVGVHLSQYALAKSIRSKID